MVIQILNLILDWSEVWALLIPLTVLLYFPKQPHFYRPIIAYLCIALLINLCIDVIWKFKYSLPLNFRNNNLLYNLHSIIRFLLFSSFFIKLNQPFLNRLKIIIPIALLILVALNFIYFESILFVSSRLFTFEAAALLFFCLQYFLFILQTDTTSVKGQPGFWVVMGLSIYVAASFFIFLFYQTLANNYRNLAFIVWDIHNVFYIILCIFIGKAFYESKQR